MATRKTRSTCCVPSHSDYCRHPMCSIHYFEGRTSNTLYLAQIGEANKKSDRHQAVSVEEFICRIKEHVYARNKRNTRIHRKFNKYLTCFYSVLRALFRFLLTTGNPICSSFSKRCLVMLLGFPSSTSLHCLR